MSNIGVAPLCSILIFCLARYRFELQWFLSRRTLVLFGEASYCMYLFHLTIIALCQPLLESARSDHLIFTFHLSFMFALLIAVCLGVYQFVEVPLRRLIRNLLVGEAPVPILKSRGRTWEPAPRAAA
jgi:peptidoglycan/LPS O-acetylase OafA/YrhL